MKKRNFKEDTYKYQDFFNGMNFNKIYDFIENNGDVNITAHRENMMIRFFDGKTDHEDLKNICLYLIEKGIDVNFIKKNSVDDQHSTLFYAVQYNDFDIIKALIEKGATPLIEEIEYPKDVIDKLSEMDEYTKQLFTYGKILNIAVNNALLMDNWCIVDYLKEKLNINEVFLNEVLPDSNNNSKKHLKKHNLKIY
jgi:ankyrin repeat protein